MAVLAVRDHRRAERLDPVDDAVEVDAERPLPHVHVVGFEHRSATAHTRGVEEEVDIAELLPGLRRHGLHRVVVGSVGHDPDGPEANGLQTSDLGLEDPLHDVGDDEIHALAAEPLGRGEADPTRPAGDHRCAVLEMIHPPILARSRADQRTGQGFRWTNTT